ncbi:MAG: transcriptional repressor LexA [Candidatus Omnitrophica bacterium]|nr:transcriptional repressor LexA [Candidatus Omnitrophota bacterium]MBU1925030.1 transcriptional repressor LexA [Candidatus Omnitrophota bacterium]
MMLTKKQNDVLMFIRQRIRQGLPPTIREIADEFRFGSTGTVRDYLKALVKKGFIALCEKKSRAIELTEKAMLNIPILGRVPAGVPVLAVENVEDYFNVDKLFSQKDDLFFLRVHGDSMIGAGIMPDDLVLVKKQSCAQDRDIVVCRVDEEEITVKILRNRENRFFLEPANKNYSIIPLNEHSQIVGKVITAIRRYI